MQHYACGFLFSTDRSRVLLIRKLRPAWQAGQLNGVGGKVESGESPIQAMRREFREEAGIEVSGWQKILRLTGPGWVGHFFRAFGDVDAAWTVTDEQLERHSTAVLPGELIPNLRWMIPMMLDEELVAEAYSVTVGGDTAQGAI